MLADLGGAMTGILKLLEVYGMAPKCDMGGGTESDDIECRLRFPTESMLRLLEEEDRIPCCLGESGMNSKEWVTRREQRCSYASHSIGW